MSEVKGQATAALRVGEVIDARYKVVRLIGQGGNGVVHEVEHVLTGRRLALKSLVEDVSPARLEQEARAACLMKNRHAVIVTDMGDFEGVGPYLVMELLEGESLRARLEQGSQLPLGLAMNLAMQVCECLAEAHERGLIHRDLKPDNIFLEPTFGDQYDVKVLDFGVVKVADDGPIPATSLTRTGSTVGTPFYMSLEQLRNSSNVDARSDVYSLCVVLYESLSGAKPFQADTIGDLVYALCSTPPTPLLRLRPDVPRKISEVIMRGLSSNRDERPQSMRELADVLAEHADAAFAIWLRADPSSSRPASAEPADASSLRRSKVPPPRPPRPGGEPDDKTIDRKPPPPPRPVGDLDSTSTAIDAPAAKSDAPAKPPKPPKPPEEPGTGDRDTPTELYIKDVHGAAGPDAAPGQRNTPTEAFGAAELAASGANLADPAAQAVDAASSVGSAAPPAPRMSTQRIPGGSVPGSPAEVQALIAAGGASPGDAHLPTLPATPTGESEVAPPRGPLDNVLATIGGAVERTVEVGTTKFRTANPQTQILVVVVSASVLAVALVLLVYVAVAPDAPPPPPPAPTPGAAAPP